MTPRTILAHPSKSRSGGRLVVPPLRLLVSCVSDGTDVDVEVVMGLPSPSWLVPLLPPGDVCRLLVRRSFRFWTIGSSSRVVMVVVAMAMLMLVLAPSPVLP